MLDFFLMCQCEFHRGQYGVDVHISIADPDAALNEDPSFRDDPEGLIYKPEKKMYAELTAFP